METALSPIPPDCPHCGGLLGNCPNEETVDQSISHLPTSEGPRSSQVAQSWSHAWHQGSLGQFGRFQLREIIGEGGYGTVYKAHDPRLDRDIALKTLKIDKMTDLTMGRFFREARTAAKLSHPGIVPAYDAGRDARGCWIAFEYVPGLTLSRHLTENTLSVRTAMRIIRDLADALQHCHDHKVMHRDLKPSNILIDEDGRPWLIDFGFARWMNHNSDFTLEKSIIGTYGYMPPEVMAGNSQKADARSDVYSLGTILFELIAHERPIQLPLGVPLHKIDTSQPPPGLRTFDEHVPREIERICAKALEPKPCDRYQDMNAFRDDLNRWLHHKPVGRRIAVIAATFLIGGSLGWSGAGLMPRSEIVQGTEIRHDVGKAPLSVLKPPEPGEQGIEPPVAAANVAEVPVSVVEPDSFEPDSSEVWVNTDTKVFHHRKCKYSKEHSGKNWQEYPSAEQALAKYFRISEECRWRFTK